MPLLDNVGSAVLSVEIHSAEGALCFDTAGRQYWDFYGGHAVTFLGQGHSKDYSVMYHNFTGHDPELEPMLEARGLAGGK